MTNDDVQDQTQPEKPEPCNRSVFLDHANGSALTELATCTKLSRLSNPRQIAADIGWLTVRTGGFEFVQTTCSETRRLL